MLREYAQDQRESEQGARGKEATGEPDHFIPVEEFAQQKGMTILEVIDHIVNDADTYRGRQDTRGHWLVDSRSPRQSSPRPLPQTQAQACGEAETEVSGAALFLARLLARHH